MSDENIPGQMVKELWNATTPKNDVLFSSDSTSHNVYRRAVKYPQGKE